MPGDNKEKITLQELTKEQRNLLVQRILAQVGGLNLGKDEKTSQVPSGKEPEGIQNILYS